MTKSSAPLAVLLALCIFWTSPLRAADRGMSFIRDAEVEATIQSYAKPLFGAAGLDPEAVRILIVNDDTLNAFVSGGMKLFLNTGLLIRAETPGQLIGVIAHETGHIAGGHLARAREEMRDSAFEQMLVFALGIGAAVASGSGQAAAAVVAGGAAVSQANALSFNRTQESAADNAALGYLDHTGRSAKGMFDFLGTLRGQELMLSGRQNPYMRTHPLTEERIAVIRRHLETSPLRDVPDSPAEIEAHARMRAKLIGFLQPLQETLRVYPETDTSLAARYARSIAYFRAAQLPAALKLIDGLIAEKPSDPYFQELKGQMLFQSGKGAAAIPYYQKAVSLAPQAPLLRLGLAQVEVEVGRPEDMKSAIRELEEVVRIEPRNAGAWRSLGIAYGKDGQIPMAALSLAEAASARGDRKEAVAQATRALKQLPSGSPAWQRAQDLTVDPDSNSAN